MLFDINSVVLFSPDDYQDIYSRAQAKFSFYAALPAMQHF